MFIVLILCSQSYEGCEIKNKKKIKKRCSPQLRNFKKLNNNQLKQGDHIKIC